MDPVSFATLGGYERSELLATLVVCAISLVAVCWPLTRGALLCWRARSATRLPRGDSPESETTAAGGVASLMREVYSAAERELRNEQPPVFVRDAARQLVIDDYETSFAQPISMYANILPPIGFIGTTCGLAVLLLSMRISHEILQLGALALALSSTIFALIGYATLEGLKIHLYARLARSIDAGLRSVA
ncbi:MAG TPA: hypothetical protein ENI85_14570 [Deltaproteobacteria bacterium]|nr:hypothetical protein [Deltaproteobacteria bacterium]